MSGERGQVSALVETVAEQISEVYLDATARAQGRLPSEREMAADLGVSRGTLRHALQVLAASGEVVNVPQSGWYSSAASYPPPRGPLLSFTESAAIRGARLESRLLRAAPRLAREQERVALALPSGARVFAVSRTRVLAGQTMCVEHNVIALDRVPGVEREFDAHSSLYAALTRQGAKPERSDLSAEAALAGEDAVHLGVDAGAPVLIEHEVVTGAHRRALMLARAVWRADRYRFRATFTALQSNALRGSADSVDPQAALSSASRNAVTKE